MKKQFLLMAMAGVALAGCVGNEVEEITSKKELSKIMFEPPVMYNHAESRAEPVPVTGELSSYPTTEEFVVYAVQHEGQFSGWNETKNKPLWGNAAFTRVKYNLDLNGWEPYDGTDFKTYYWNLGTHAAFAAYSPAGATGSKQYSADGLTITDFEVEDEPVNQYDLMFSTRSIDVTHSNQTYHGYSGTPILFHHALTSIRFAIVSGEVAAKLLKISLHNVYSTGTFKENIEEKDDAGNLLGYYLRAENNHPQNVAPAWTGQKDKKNYQVYDLTSEAFDVEFTESPQFILDIIKSTTGNVYAKAKNVLMIPQTFTKTGTGNTFDITEDAYLEVEYDVTESGHKHFGVNKAQIPLADFFEGQWHWGTRQIYILSLGGSSKVFFAPGIEDWKELDHDAVIQLDNYHITTP